MAKRTDSTERKAIQIIWSDTDRRILLCNGRLRFSGPLVFRL